MLLGQLNFEGLNKIEVAIERMMIEIQREMIAVYQGEYSEDIE